MSGVIPYSNGAMKRGTTVIDQMLSQSIAFNSQVQRLLSDGQADPRALAMLTQDTRINLVTHGIASALAITTWEGVSIAAGNVGEFYWTKHADLSLIHI